MNGTPAPDLAAEELMTRAKKAPLAAKDAENREKDAQIELYKRAVKWLLNHPMAHAFHRDKRNRFVEILSFGAAFEVPAEFAEIIKPR